MLFGAEYDIQIEPLFLVLSVIVVLVVGALAYYALRERHYRLLPSRFANAAANPSISTFVRFSVTAKLTQSANCG